jgi:NAD(P)-dependent dehydrogenase (short-subunit alcohol dehydrogenase family)
MKIDLQGKTIIVTGASSGIGQATATLLAESGATVIAVARTILSTPLASAPGIRPVAADLADPTSVEAIIAEATTGGAAIDGIVNAGGHFTTAPLIDTPVEEFDLLWQVHVRTPFLLTKAAVPHLAEGSSIVFVSSTVARTGFAPYAAYTAVKGAIDSMSRSLAIELAPRTRVNTLMPGFTATPMMGNQYVEADWLEGAIIQRTPLGHIGGPEYAANVVAFLLAPESAYTTASAVVVDGGWSGQGWQSL